MKKIIRITLCLCMAFIFLAGMTTVSFGENGKEDGKRATFGGIEYYYDEETETWFEVSGNGSIADDPTKPTVIDSGKTETGAVDTSSKYSGSPSDIVKRFNYDPENMKTTDGLTVNLRLYDRITEMIDLGEMKNGVISYELKGTKKITVKANVLIGLKKSDVLVMIVNPDTGRVYLISPSEFDSEKGIMTFVTPSYGKFCIIQKLPIVVRDMHPEEYPNLEVGESVAKLPGDEYVELKEWLEAFGIEDEKLEIANDYFVDVDDYDAANYISDVAVKVNDNVFNYKLNTRMWADLYQDVNECDWGRVLDYAGVDYDAEAIKKDPTKLTKIKPFKLKNCFIYHVDAETADVSIAFEPEISFDTVDNGYDATDKKVKNGLQKLEKDDIDMKMKSLDDVDNVNEVEDNVNHKEKKELEDPDVNDTSWMDNVITPVYAKAQDHYTKEQRDILTFDVNDIDERNMKNLCMVMSSDQYLGMGPFVLMMPKDKMSLWWIWIILIILTIIAIIVIYKRIKDKRVPEEAVPAEGVQADDMQPEDVRMD